MSLCSLGRPLETKPNLKNPTKSRLGKTSPPFATSAFTSSAMNCSTLPAHLFSPEQKNSPVSSKESPHRKTKNESHRSRGHRAQRPPHPHWPAPPKRHLSAEMGVSRRKSGRRRNAGSRVS